MAGCSLPVAPARRPRVGDEGSRGHAASALDLVGQPHSRLCLFSFVEDVPLQGGRPVAAVPPPSCATCPPCVTGGDHGRAGLLCAFLGLSRAGCGPLPAVNPPLSCGPSRERRVHFRSGYPEDGSPLLGLGGAPPPPHRCLWRRRRHGGEPPPPPPPAQHPLPAVSIRPPPAEAAPPQSQSPHKLPSVATAADAAAATFTTPPPRRGASAGPLVLKA